jgi:MYXO-CTERM domain-containing protein
VPNADTIGSIMKPAALALALAPATLAVVLASATAHAHLRLESPMPRWPDTPDDVYIKTGPCGMAGGAAGPSVDTFTAGDMITVSWTETIDHPGHYRISLTDQGDGAFVDPAAYDDFYSADNVLLDDIEDQGGFQTPYSTMVQIPEDMSCDACVLQVIQVMTDKSPYGDGDDIYYQCADITILPLGGGSSGEGDTSGGADESSDGGGGGGSSGGPNDSGPSDAGTSADGTGGSEDDLGTEGSSAPLTDTGDTDKNGGGCGCRTQEHAGWALPLVGVALVRRRARRQGRS